MIPDDLINLQWQQLTEKIFRQKGIEPGIDEILLFIGEKECGMPPKPVYTEREKADLIQMAISTVLVPARYYELFWVEETGWPHYRQLQRVPPMNEEEKLRFLKPWITRYADKNRML